MKPDTAEWVAKAEGDFAVMERESRVAKDPSYDAVCYHAQQCAEKYLKARLIESGIPFKKIHDLQVLLDSALSVEPLWEMYRPDLVFLTDFASEVRYPGEDADRAMARDARKRCRLFREAARKTLGLPPGKAALK